MKFYHPLTNEEITSPFFKMQAFKSFLYEKYGTEYKGSQLTDEELELHCELKEAIGKDSAAFIASPCSNAR